MAKQVFHVNSPEEYQKAGPTDLIELLPAPGSNQLFLMKWLLEILVYAIVQREFIHLSGPTGTAKSSLIEALYLVPENFASLCRAMGFEQKPLKVYAIEMATYEAPGELYNRRALKNGTTYDEMSRLVQALEDASRTKEANYALVWLREMGRVHSSTVQGGLLNLMTKGDVVLPDGRRIDGLGIAWVADSNYQAEQDASHTLVPLDDALKRRFSINLTLDYLSAEQEAQILEHLAAKMGAPGDGRLIEKVVTLGQVIRRHKGEGDLQSVVPPTIYGYLAVVRMAGRMPHLSIQQIVRTTLLGNAKGDDQKLIPGIINEVFGLKAGDDADPAVGNDLF